jgi:Fe-S cluster assembly scaffold protein SufB
MLYLKIWCRSRASAAVFPSSMTSEEKRETTPGSEVIHLNLAGQNVYQGYQIDLAGYKSSLKTDIAYRLKGSEHLDMNYFANHTGKKTECEINVNGVLRDTSSKILRATIDLKKGAKGAVGNEKEDVLLMDEGVRNKTIPLILCTEEDVEGNHGATIGRLDESLMFYMKSRGLNPKSRSTR